MSTPAAAAIPTSGVLQPGVPFVLTTVIGGKTYKWTLSLTADAAGTTINLNIASAVVTNSAGGPVTSSAGTPVVP